MKRLFIYIFAVLPFACYSQTVLTLDECIRLAKENNKRMEVSEQQLQASLFEKRSTKALFLPSLSLTGNALYSTADGSYSSGMGQLPVLGADGIPTGQSALFPGIDLAYDLGWIYSGGVKVEQPVYMGGKIRTSYRMAKIGDEIARQNKRLTESEVVVETSRAYAGVVRAKELVLVAESYNELLTELMRTVESARKHGMKSQNDVLKVKVKLNESELYLMLEQQNELAKQKIAVARSEHLPQVGLVGQYGYLNGIELNGRKLLDSWNFLVGVQVSIPIFDFGHRTNKIKSAKAQYTQVQAEREDTNERLTLEMTQSFNNLDEAFLEKRLAESSVVSAEENLRASRLQYEKGVETLSDYLEAQTLWQQAMQTQVEARINCYLRWLEYQKAVGKIN